MIFLIEYDRKPGQILTFRRFEDADRKTAMDARFDLELDLFRRGIDHEVVTLEAPNEELVRKTHARYFKTLKELLDPSFLNA